MKLYHSDDGRWFGTQVDVKRHAREANTDWEERNVPTDKPGLIEYLNNLGEAPMVTATQLVPVPAQLDPLQQSELRAVAAAKAVSMSQERQLTADSIVRFILDDATVAQAEAVFAALGTRFKEQVNAAR